MAEDSYAARFAIALERWKATNPDAGDKGFAEAAGLTQPHFSGLKRRVDPPGYDVLLRMARVLGVDPGWLAFGGDSRAPAPPAVVKRTRGRLITEEEAARAAAAEEKPGRKRRA